MPELSLTSFVAVAAVYLVAINLIGFGVFALDKRRACNREWRIKEKTLLRLAASGATVGFVVGQKLLRHKTRKEPFKTYLQIIIVVQLATLALISIPAGQEIAESFFWDMFASRKV